MTHNTTSHINISDSAYAQLVELANDSFPLDQAEFAELLSAGLVNEDFMVTEQGYAVIISREDLR